MSDKTIDRDLVEKLLRRIVALEERVGELDMLVREIYRKKRLNESAVPCFLF